MENIYDLTNFNLEKDPLLTFIVKIKNNETVILCNDNIIGTYNGFISEHDITDIINQLLYEKNIGIDKLCFIMGKGEFISIKTDNKSYNDINKHTVVEKFKTISLYFSPNNGPNKHCILKCFITNYKLDEMAYYMNHDKTNSNYAHIVSPVYDEEDEIDNDNINVTLYFDMNGLHNNSILYKLEDVKETFIKNIKFISTDNRYIILGKLFEIHKDTYYRLYVCKIYNIDLDKSVNVCFFNNMNKFTHSNNIINIKEYDKYINILDNKIFIDLTEYKYYIYKSYINYNLEDS